MATTIVLKNSVTTTNTPSSLTQGEVAINVTDKKVWVGNAATTPVQLIGSGSDGAFSTLSVSGQLTLTKATDYNLYASGAGGNYMAGSLLLGTTSTTSRLTNQLNITGATTSYGYMGNGPILSDVTTQGIYYATLANTQASAFTLATMIHYSAGQSTIGSTSAVTNQYGFSVGSTLTGATNNYGFRGILASATGVYNLYMSGTASNYLAGQLLVGTTVSGNGYIQLAPTQSTNPYQTLIGGTNTYAGSVTGLYVNPTLTGTSATTAGTGLYVGPTFGIPASGTIANIIGIQAQPNFTTTSTVTNLSGIYSILQFGAAAIGNTLTNAYSYNAVSPSINASTTTAITTAAHFNAANIAGTAGSAITTAVAFYGRQASSNTGVTNNYNLYMSGTAPNYMAGALGIGVTPSGSVYALRNAIAISGATTAFGYTFEGTIQSSVTSSATIFASIPNTQATAFTLSNLYNFNAAQGTIGAGSAVTNQYGYLADSSLIGATNNYGFYGNLAAATGRYNLYMTGTAANYFGGDMQFNKTVTAAGTTGAQTISKNAGTVNFAAAATSLVVTNTLVTANSIIICTVGTNDTTMKSASAVAAAGSFTIYGNAAATAETRVNFIVIN